MREALEQIGAFHIEQAFDCKLWEPLVGKLPASPGTRLRHNKGLADLLGLDSVPHRIACQRLGSDAIPVRAILFDKTELHNWPLGWHQDRTIAVEARHDLEGFNRWTVKQGMLHVEPPFRFIENMITLRLHLDDVTADNAPLRIAPGSHKLGLIREAEYLDVAKAHGEQTCPAATGDIWVYSTSILHASAAAQKPARRRVVQIDYTAEVLPEPLAWSGI